MTATVYLLGIMAGVALATVTTLIWAIRIIREERH